MTYTDVVVRPEHHTDTRTQPTQTQPTQTQPTPTQFTPSQPTPTRQGPPSRAVGRTDVEQGTSAPRPGSPEAIAVDVPSRNDVLTVVPWWDPNLAIKGVDPRDAYVERFWLGVLGPSTVLLLRRFARGLEERPSGFRVGLVDTSLALGLGKGTGRNAAITRTISRADTFGLLRQLDSGQIEVRTHLPLLPTRFVRQLPPLLRTTHAEWVAQHRPQASAQGRQPGRPR